MNPAFFSRTTSMVSSLISSRPSGASAFVAVVPLIDRAHPFRRPGLQDLVVNGQLTVVIDDQSGSMNWTWPISGKAFSEVFFRGGKKALYIPFSDKVDDTADLSNLQISIGNTHLHLPFERLEDILSNNKLDVEEICLIIRSDGEVGVFSLL